MTQDTLNQYRKEVSEKANKVAESTLEKSKSREYTPFNNYLTGKLQSIVAELAGVSADEIEFNIPPVHIPADLSFSTFEIAKKTNTNPKDLAEKIAEGINKEPTTLGTAETAGPYLNINLNKPDVYAQGLRQAQDLGGAFGNSDVNRGKIGVIDLSSPNIAKPIGVGHLRSTIIGNSIAMLYEATGYTMIRDNHLGDWGTQFGKLVYAFQNWGDEKKMEEKPIEYLEDLYIRFHKEALSNPMLEDEARETFKKLEQGDPQITALWKKFRDLSISEFENTYNRLGVEFDLDIGEAFYADKSDEVIKDALDKKACVEEEAGGVVVCEIDNLPSFLLRKGDGASLYATRDLATIKFREEVFHPDTIIYVVGDEQSLYFKQIFALAKEMGYAAETTELKHIGFGMVLGADGKKMSTRQGTLIELDELLSKSVAESQRILKDRYPDKTQEELEGIAKALGISAIIFNDLRQGRERNISFDWKQMLDFKAGSAVYLQYSSVRINSILEKVKKDKSINEFSLPKNVIFESDSEFELMKRIMFFPSVIVRAQATDSPHLIRTYLEELTDSFNSFYETVSIIKTENEDLFQSQLALVNATNQVIKKGLGLLGVQVPQMI